MADIAAGSVWTAIDEIGDPGAGLRFATLATVEAFVNGPTDGIGGDEGDDIVVFTWIDPTGNPRRTAWDAPTFITYFAPAEVSAPSVTEAASAQ